MEPDYFYVDPDWRLVSGQFSVVDVPHTFASSVCDHNMDFNVIGCVVLGFCLGLIFSIFVVGFKRG